MVQRTDDRHSPAFAHFMSTQTVHVDLTSPPDRAKVGMGPRGGAVIVERTSEDRMLDVAFTLPAGKRLRVPAFGVTFHTDAADPDTAPPRNIVVNRRVPDADAARSALLADADALGFDRAEVERWYADHGKRPLRPLDTGRVSITQVSYLQIAITTRQSDGGDVQIDYLLSWDA